MSLPVSSFYLAEVPEQHLFHYLEDVCPEWVEIFPRDPEHPGTVEFSSLPTSSLDEPHIPHIPHISFTVVIKDRKPNPEEEDMGLDTGMDRILIWDFFKKTFTFSSSSSSSSYPSYPWFIIRDTDGEKEKKGETKKMVGVLLHPSFFDREG
jgi:hypothetical protein